MIDSNLLALQDAGCLRVEPSDGAVHTLPLGRLASLYYLKHQTMATFSKKLEIGGAEDVRGALETMCAAAEYDELPVRHNEDVLNAGLAGEVRWRPDMKTVGELMGWVQGLRVLYPRFFFSSFQCFLL
jgi:activating signal cointegrator complex subunit 3